MSDSPEERIFTVTSLQILVTYSLYNKEKAISLDLYTKTLQECRTLGDTSLLVIPPVHNKELRMIEADMPEPDITTTQPLRLAVICVVSKATEMFSNYQTKQAIRRCMLRMSNQTERQILLHSIGLWTFQRNVKLALELILNNPEEASKLSDTWIRYHKMTLKQSGQDIPRDKAKPNENLDVNLRQEGLLRCYFDYGSALHQMQNYSGAIQSFQRALEVATELFGGRTPKNSSNLLLPWSNTTCFRQLLVSTSVRSARS